MVDELRAAREELLEVTPLKRDCGKVCGARCCDSLEGEETGMLLFPGEEEACRNRPGWKLRETARGWLLICSGLCSREERPLACRMFPLLPVPEGQEIRVRTDERARAVCPLTRQGKQGMDPAFVEAVRRAGELLIRQEDQRVFLEALKAEQAEIRRIRKELGGDV